MAITDFTKKGLNQKIITNKSVRPKKTKNSRGMRVLMGKKEVAHIVDKMDEKRVFYNALRKRGLESKRGITRNVLKKVLGDIEHSGEFSYAEMLGLRKNLVGGPMSSNIIREHISKKEETSKETVVNMREIYDEIMDKNKKNLSNLSSDEQKNNNPKAVGSKVLNFGVSEKNLRNAQQLFIQKSDEYPIPNHSSSMVEYIANHQSNDDDLEDKDVRNRLARILEKAVIPESTNTSFTNTKESPEFLSQKITEQPREELADPEGKNEMEDVKKEISEKAKMTTEIAAGAIDREKLWLNKEENAKKDDNEKMNEKNIAQFIKIGQEKLFAMFSAGQEDSPNYQKLFALLIKNQNGANIWKSAEEIDIASVEIFLEENSEEEKNSVADLGSNNKPKSVNTEKIRVDDEKTDLAA